MEADQHNTGQSCADALTALTRRQLNDVATKLGVTNSSAFDNKDRLVDHLIESYPENEILACVRPSWWKRNEGLAWTGLVLSAVGLVTPFMVSSDKDRVSNDSSDSLKNRLTEVVGRMEIDQGQRPQELAKRARTVTLVRSRLAQFPLESEYASLASRELNTGGVDSAITLLENAARVIPERSSGELELCIGLLKGAMNHGEGQLQALEEAYRRSPDSLFYLSRLVEAALEQGKYERAGVLIDERLRAGATVPKGCALAALRLLQARTYNSQGRYEEAIGSLREMPTEPACAGISEFSVHQEFMQGFRRLGQYDSADVHLTKMAQRFDHASIEDAYNMAEYFNDCGVFRQEQGRYKEAEAYYLRALETIKKNQLGFRIEALVKDSYGVVLMNLGRLDEANAMYRSNLDIYTRGFGKDHPEMAYTLNNYGVAWRERAMMLGMPAFLDSALLCATWALEIRTTHTGVALDEIGVSYNLLGVIYDDLGKADQAERMYDSVRTYFDRAEVGENSSRRLVLNGNIARLLHHRGRFDQADRLFRTTLEQFAEPQLHKSSARLKIQVYYAQMKLQTGYKAEGLRLLAEAGREVREQLGPGHPSLKWIERIEKEL